MTSSAVSRSGARALLARLALLASLPALPAMMLACASAGGSQSRALGELTNPFLGPELSDWLVGPAAHIATREELDQYLALREDKAAAGFIESFWARRNPTPKRPVNPLREAFEERGAEADHLYGEAGVRGRHTDRGTTLVLYGPPRKISFEVAFNPADPPIEVWTYGSEASAGLDGKRPAPAVRFSKRGDLTVFYVPRPADNRTLRRPRLGEPPPS